MKFQKKEITVVFNKRQIPLDYFDKIEDAVRKFSDEEKPEVPSEFLKRNSKLEIVSRSIYIKDLDMMKDNQVGRIIYAIVDGVRSPKTIEESIPTRYYIQTDLDIYEIEKP